LQRLNALKKNPAETWDRKKNSCRKNSPPPPGISNGPPLIEL
jgi:hypothetical protein